MQDFRILDMDLIFILFEEVRDKLENVQGTRSKTQFSIFEKEPTDFLEVKTIIIKT